MIDRLARHPHYCFLDKYSGYNQIAIALKDQEKTTFTCPYGTFSFKRMPFQLCNASTTFQRCIMSIFSYLVDEVMEIFMDEYMGPVLRVAWRIWQLYFRGARTRTWLSIRRNVILW